MNFYGFKIDTKNFDRIDQAIADMKVAIREKAQKQYTQLLSEEIETYTDEVIMGMHDNEKIESIYESAMALLNKKIAVAIAKGFDTQYNFSVAINIFSYNKEVYIQAATYNRGLFEAMKTIKSVRIEDLTVDEATEQQIREKRYSLWENIVKQYQDHSCMIVKMFPLNNPFDKPEFDKMKFNTPIHRAEIHARHRLINQYLSMYAGGGDIPPQKLMDYLDQAYLKAAGPEAKEPIENYKSNLLQFLPVINKEIVMTKLNSESPVKTQIDDILCGNTNEKTESETETDSDNGDASSTLNSTENESE